MPYYMNIMAKDRAELVELAVRDDHRVYPLCEVVVQKVQENRMSEKDLADSHAVIFTFMK